MTTTMAAAATTTTTTMSSSCSQKTEGRRLTCGICGKLYDEPRILACLHTFCTKCIEGIDSYLPPDLLPEMVKSTTSTGGSAAPEMNGGHRTALRSRTLDSCSKESSTATSGYESEHSPTDSFGSLAPTPQPRPASVDVERPPSSKEECGGKRRTIVCPTCDSEVDMPEGGTSHLPLNYVVIKKVLAAVTATGDVAGDRSRPVCTLCVGEAPALAWCVDCSTHLCAFCSEAHKRQRRTGKHRTAPLDEVTVRRRVATVTSPNSLEEAVSGGWPVCRRHPSEELKLYCETCGVTLCQLCAVGAEHRAHPLCPVASDGARSHIKQLAELLARTRPRAAEIRAGLAAVRATAKRVHARHSEVGREVDVFADDYVRAVNRHRDNLLERVRRAGETKQRVLKLQGVHLEQALEDVEGSCAFAEQLLAEGSDAEVLSLAGHVSRRLRDLGLERRQLEPRVDEFIDFAPAEAAGRVSGFPVKGTVTAQRVCPAQCSLKGNALPVARQGVRCDVILVTKDSEGQLMRRGGTSPVVKLLSKVNDREVPVKVTDRKDGTYALSFQTEELGLFWLHVKILDKHIQGSPYPLPIKPKRLKHYGIFHCCTFCSSGGQRHVSCGCGSTIQGGYKGCGHGHQGHPGKRHWSCCGRVGENSECASIPIMYQVSL